VRLIRTDNSICSTNLSLPRPYLSRLRRILSPDCVLLRGLLSSALLARTLLGGTTGFFSCDWVLLPRLWQVLSSECVLLRGLRSGLSSALRLSSFRAIFLSLCRSRRRRRAADC